MELLENKKVTAGRRKRRSGRGPTACRATASSSSRADREEHSVRSCDDQAFFVASRLDLIRGSDISSRLLVRFGLVMNFGKNGGKSKT